METETLRVHRVRREPIATWGPWRIGPLPPRDTFDQIDIKWALIAEEPMDSAGNAPSPGDQLIGRLEAHSEDKVLCVISGGMTGKDDQRWRATLAPETRDDDAEGRGETVVEAIQRMLEP